MVFLKQWRKGVFLACRNENELPFAQLDSPLVTGGKKWGIKYRGGDCRNPFPADAPYNASLPTKEKAIEELERVIKVASDEQLNIKMATPGQKFFSVWDGKLQKVTLIQEGLSTPECIVTTYLMRGDDGREFRCGKEMYVKTELEAWERYLNDLVESLPDIELQFDNAYEQLGNHQSQIEQVTKKLSELRGAESSVVQRTTSSSFATNGSKYGP